MQLQAQAFFYAMVLPNIYIFKVKGLRLELLYMSIVIKSYLKIFLKFTLITLGLISAFRVYLTCFKEKNKWNSFLIASVFTFSPDGIKYISVLSISLLWKNKDDKIGYLS